MVNRSLSLFVYRKFDRTAMIFPLEIESVCGCPAPHTLLTVPSTTKGGATGWTGVDMSTPLSSGRYSFLGKNDIKIIRYTFWHRFYLFSTPLFLGWCRPCPLLKNFAIPGWSVHADMPTCSTISCKSGNFPRNCNRDKPSFD